MAERRKRTRTDPYADALQILGSDDTDQLYALLANFGPMLPAERLRWEPSVRESAAAIEWNPNGVDGPLDPVPVGELGRLQLTTSGAVDREALTALVNSIRLLGAEAELSDELMASRAEETRARLALRGTRHQLTVTRDLERQRLVAALLKFAGEPLAAVSESLDELEQNATEDRLADVRDALDLAIERFRTVARGIYPVMLRERGPFETLQQLAGILPGPVEFTGSLGARAGWEVESGLYHAAARALTVLSESSETPVRACFDRDRDRLGLTLTATLQAGSVDVGAALSDPAGRIVALGGGLTVRTDAADTTVELWLFDGLDYRP